MEQPISRGKRVAFFGGSFDPPHLGHLAVARAAQRALDLDSVLFAPVGAQPLKPLGSTAHFEDRLAMTRLATADEAEFAVSMVDAPKAGGAPNFTLDSLRALRKELPGDGSLFCLMGADSYFGLRRWHGGAEIPFAAALIVASRPGEPLDDLRAALPEGLDLEAEPGASGTNSGSHDLALTVRSYRIRNSHGLVAPFYVLPGLHVDVSASAIREQVRAAAGSSLLAHPLLPSAVMDYIRAHGLYQ